MVYYYSYQDHGGEVTISAPYSDYADCFEDYVCEMELKQAQGHDIAVFEWRGVFTADRIKEIIREYL